MKITRETLYNSLVLLVEANNIVFTTVKTAKDLGLVPEEMQALPFTLDECHTISMATKKAHDILSELSDSL